MLYQITSIHRAPLTAGGEVTTLYAGANFSIIIHPEHRRVFEDVVKVGRCGAFTDETGRTWLVELLCDPAGIPNDDVTSRGENLRITSDNMQVEVPVFEILPDWFDEQ